jgi:hypothetical protein
VDLGSERGLRRSRGKGGGSISRVDYRHLIGFRLILLSWGWLGGRNNSRSLRLNRESRVYRNVPDVLTLILFISLISVEGTNLCEWRNNRPLRWLIPHPRLRSHITPIGGHGRWGRRTRLTWMTEVHREEIRMRHILRRRWGMGISSILISIWR